MKVLVVEDHEKLANSIQTGLANEGFEVEVCLDGESALDRIESVVFDCILLDVLLPDMTGFEICKYIRQELHSRTPVIMLTALDSVESKVSGLDCGADDYIVKPFHFKELNARIHAVIRRNNQQIGDVIKYGPFSYDPYKKAFQVHNTIVQLSKRELELMELFLKNPQKVLSRETIKAEIWGEEEEVKSNIVDVYVLYLRKRLKPYGLEKSIKTYPQVGYVLEIES